ncbi:hypothetical protein FXV83_23205 [Bradyrhizobium hipponense]|uniref:Uncharacterized protein n=1 Tax=Bradyrhizobium hipponense TaxID=2605638 RepID=A0A5S4YLC8_9BRAD|nr:hypothetical protein [Bradyrhizobium hipponense]TYO64277.1 hypothetical protein FXV83_23205 [Bradyrhizobium hipponense]
MSQRLETLRKRFIDAKADADASNREMRLASVAKLAELRALPDPTARLAGLKDPALLPYDREMLERTVADLLPRRRIRLPRTIGETMRSGIRHARYHWRGLVVLTLISIPVTVIGGFAVHNTGHAIVHFDRELDLTWTFPDGHTELRRLPTDTAVVVMGRNAAGDVRLRFWSAEEGHLEAIMPAEAYDRFVTSTSE